MDFKTKFRFDIPEALIEALGINDDTVFIVSYENGSITVEPLTEEENIEGIEEYEDEIEDAFDDGYDEGYCTGYPEGYGKGFTDAKAGIKYDDSVPEKE